MNKQSYIFNARRRVLAVAACASVLLAGAVLPTAGRAEAAEAVTASTEADGLTEATAAASCWEIKQNAPASTNGVYWLYTPALGAPQQFYCDQERQGGGWLLVGRGRDGWSSSTQGSGTPAQVSSTVSGQAAFTPRQLPGPMIDQLLNGDPVKSLPDGVRLVRATNQAGTQWQDATFTYESPRSTWTWNFNTQERVDTAKFGSVTSRGGKVSDFGTDSSYNRVRTITGSTEGWQAGFGYGSNVRGAPDAGSYLWSKNTSTGYARPFTQVFVRPQLRSTDINESFPSGGTAARTVTSVANSFALTQNWGVAGLGNGPSTIEGSNEVSAFTEVNGTVFVGGNFLRAQKTSGGGSATNQAYLAAFDRDTAELKTGFNPTFNNQIKALATLPGNRIAVGGYFTEVNGSPHNGLVVLNAATGQVDTAFTGKLINYIGNGVPVVRTLDVEGDWLYVGGVFTHSTGGSNPREVYTRNAAKFAVGNGTPDSSWNPEFNGSVISLDASEQGDRVYFAGFFSQSQGRDADKAAAMSSQNTNLIPWNVVFSNRANGRTGYQQAVLEVGNSVWLGGSEHSLMRYSRDGLNMLNSSIGSTGGDFQALATDGTAVYGGCHCFEDQYEGSTTWPNIGTSWTSADAIYGTGAWSAADGKRIPEFNGTFNTARGAGSWALFVDSNGTLWQGGDWTYSHRAGWNRQWSGGFVRHAQNDVTPPSAPGQFSAVQGEGGVSLSWSAATDTGGNVAYEVMRDDRVVATVTDTSLTLPEGEATTKYFVRAVDQAGNRSASTRAVQAEQPPLEPSSVTYVPTGSDWKYVYSESGPSGDWTTRGYNDASWATGTAPFGWGHTNIATPLTADAPKPAVSFYRKTFTVEQASAVTAAQITTRADDGIVVYVNGTEVGRTRVDPGPVGPRTYANAAVNASTALANPVQYAIPNDLLRDGENVVTVSVHSNYRSTPSHSFELEATATMGSPAAVAREEKAQARASEEEDKAQADEEKAQSKDAETKAEGKSRSAEADTQSPVEKKKGIGSAKEPSKEPSKPESKADVEPSAQPDTSAQPETSAQPKPSAEPESADETESSEPETREDAQR
ncbi:fibrinogen-like YCDxxxxGGGW domain-containing protein [Galactobacter sp.]|uniref:fibrinogen-like YCDxxxxGGGW domain-containing protein n=1 Tax=Galactobacter sp. TaxID=2676125 RepID=UPI0025BE752E|nr:fibrinogen-like YCDxxxxGGGW domain-containing protein [Galactobacter sp.]